MSKTKDGGYYHMLADLAGELTVDLNIDLDKS